MPATIDLSDGQPRRFGDYIIHGLLGEGGMARVYAGEEVLSHRRVAIKVLRSEFARSEQGRRQFLTEMNILASLDDPHIVRCLACTQIESQPVMVLELLEGWTLRQMLKARVVLPWTEAVSYAHQIAKALVTAHNRQPRIVHRDLKPENVIVQRNGHVKVMDFGIAKVLMTLAGSTTQPIGTLQYMSPEHIDARPVDGRADLFSLGLLMWEMLAGQPAFHSDSPRLLLEKICTRPTPPLPEQARAGLPPQIEQLIGQLLQKDPGSRPASARDLVAALEPFVHPVAPQSTAQPRANPTEQQQQARSDRWPSAPSVQADTIAIVESARKGPLQKQVEAQVEDVAQAVTRFAEATSAWIVRLLVGLLILPAAAVLFVGLPLLFVGINASLLKSAGAKLDLAGLDAWLPVECLATLALASSVTFLRGCWAHRRAPKPNLGMSAKLWLVLVGLLFAAWAAATGLEHVPQTSLSGSIHLFLMAANFCGLVVTGSWIAGHLASRLLARLDRKPSFD